MSQSSEKKNAGKVRFLDLRSEYDPLRDQIIDALGRVADSGQYILGAELEAFEREIAVQVGADFAIGVSSGTDALLVSLMAIGVSAGDEVIVPSFSFFATAGCVARLGARPVFVDIDRGTFNIDLQQVESATTPRTRAVIPVHLFGLCADMAPLLDYTRPKGIAVVEDAAQAIGATYKDAPAGTLGDFGCFSFFPTKNLGGMGDSGLVVVGTQGNSDLVRTLRAHGSQRKYYHSLVGGNFRMDPLQAAVLRVKAPHLAEWTEARRDNANRYRELFAEHDPDSRVGLPEEPEGYYHVFNQFVVRVPQRDELKNFLSDQGIGTNVYYPVPFHLQECFASLGQERGSLPVSERAAEEVLALPIYPGLTEAQQQRVVRTIATFLYR